MRLGNSSRRMVSSLVTCMTVVLPVDPNPGPALSPVSGKSAGRSWVCPLTPDPFPPNSGGKGRWQRGLSGAYLEEITSLAGTLASVETEGGRGGETVSNGGAAIAAATMEGTVPN